MLLGFRGMKGMKGMKGMRMMMMRRRRMKGRVRCGVREHVGEGSVPPFAAPPCGCAR